MNIMMKKSTYNKSDLEKILNCLPGMAYRCLYDEDWTMKFVSEGCKHLTGYQEEEILENAALSYKEIIHAADRDKVNKEVTQGVKDHGSYNIEYRIFTKEGEMKWVWEQGRAIYDKNDNVKYLLGFITNITNRKLNYNELKDTKERLELAVQGANLGVWDWNIKTGRININKNWTDMLGFDQDDIDPIVDEWERLIHPDDKDNVYNNLKEHLAGETKYYSVEHRLATKEGGYKWVRDIGKVFKRDKEGNPLRAVGIHLDIDDAKRIEKQLRASEEKFRTYIENAPIGVFVVDYEGNILEVNDHAAKMTGYGEEELKNLTLFELTARSEKETKYYLRNFKRKGQIEIEGKFIKKNDEQFYAKVNGIVIDEDKFLGFVEDIDKRIKMRNRLKRQKAYFEQLFNESTEGIVLLNNKGIILKVNNHFLEIYGYDRDEVVGENIDDLITPPDRKEEGIYYTEEVMAGNDIKEESVKVTKSGERIHVSIHAFPIKLDEGQIGIYGIYNDITERKKEEEKRRYLSFHDQLTDLYNRRYFENEMERLGGSRKTPISMIIADIDGLKEVNDTKGHQWGDKHIKNTADIISGVTRQEDIVARIGGDEFAILLPETDEKGTHKVIDRIKESIEFRNKSAEVPLSISIGYSVQENKDGNLEENFKKADKMMYHRKRNKKHNSC